MRLFLTPSFALLLATCGPSEQPTSGEPVVHHDDLSRGFRPNVAAVMDDPGLDWSVLKDVPDRAGAWTLQQLKPVHWTHLGGGVWQARRRVLGDEPARSGFGSRFNAMGKMLTNLGRTGLVEELPARDDSAAMENFAQRVRRSVGRGSFFVLDAEVLAVLEPDAPAPEGSLHTFIDMGWPEGDSWRVELGPYSGTGMPLFTDIPQEKECDLPAHAALRFSLVVPAGVEYQGVALEVNLNGERIFRSSYELGPAARIFEQEILLPPEGVIGASLTFETHGTLGLSILLAPRIGPAEPPPYARRAGPPNIVLFLADTFRADNLASLGGDPAWTPHLNRLAQESRNFVDARSTTTWTLPAHASLFSGLMPRQIGAQSRRGRLPLEVFTIAEMLSAAGYRTAAVTDRGYVSRAYGLEQGFEFFEEQPRTEERTLAALEDALGRDDGRPLFLFVHSYRAHGPYRVSDEVAARLGLEGDEKAPSLAQLVKLELVRGVAATGENAELIAKAEEQYRGSSAELDILFDVVRRELEARGVLDRGVLIFTSDHGEAFGEHGVVGHGDGVWDEELRIPLLLHGPSIEAGQFEGPVSLIDLPRTLAELAGIVPHPGWRGVSLVGDPEDRPLFAFQCGSATENAAAIWAARKKLIVRCDPETGALGEVQANYDLAADPGEVTDLGRDARWFETFVERFVPTAKALSQLQIAGGEAAVDAEQAAELEALGYAGDDE